MIEDKKEIMIPNNKSQVSLKMLPTRDIKRWYNNFVKLSKDILKENLDYGVIPGVSKPSLFKPGAEKLRFVYRLRTQMERTDTILDIDNNLIDFTYKCTVSAPTGEFLADCEGNCNSWEDKFRYHWIRESELPAGTDIKGLKTKGGRKQEFLFAVDKSETGGQYGKPTEYWNKWKEAIASGQAKSIQIKTRAGKMMAGWEMEDILYRVENDNVASQKNTIMKMAQKRAFVGAILIVTGASEFFTQDVEDMEIIGEEMIVPAKATLAMKPIPATDFQRKKIFALGKSLGKEGEETKEAIKKYFKLESFNDLTLEEANRAISSLQAKVEAAARQPQDEEVNLDEIDKGLDDQREEAKQSGDIPF